MLRGLDSETFLIFPGMMAPPLVCVSWAEQGGSDGVFHHSDPSLFDFLLQAIRERTVFANAPFDLAVFGNWDVRLIDPIFEALDEGRIYDVLMRDKLIDLAQGRFRFEEDEDGDVKYRGYSLFDVTKRRLGVWLKKDKWRKRYHDLWDTPITWWPKEAVEYASEDAKAPVAIWEQQEEIRGKFTEAVGMDLLGNEEAQNQAALALHLMTCWGFKTDSWAVGRLERRVREALEEIRDELVVTGLVREDGSRDTKEAVRRMIEVVGDEVTITAAGQDLIQEKALSHEEFLRIAMDKGAYVSVAEDPCIMSGDPDLQKYSKYVRFRNLLTGSVKHMRAGTVTPIQSRFDPLKETGRTGSSAPNIQNLRRAPGVRECFVPRVGKVLIACDYSAAELHTLAQVCYDLFGFSKLGDALNAGIDVHSSVGSQLIQVPYEIIRAEYRDVEEYNDARQLAKAANFGFPGGCSAARLVGIAHGYGLEIDLHTAAKAKAIWSGSWEEMPLFFDHVRECIDSNGWYWVRQNRVDRLRCRCTFTSACNSYFQGLASDGAKAALYAVTREQFTDEDSPLWNTRCVAFVHDEIIIEAPEAQAHDAAMRLQAVMEREFNKFVPDCPTEAEPTIMRYWSKKAKQVWTDDGVLTPWEGLRA